MLVQGLSCLNSLSVLKDDSHSGRRGFLCRLIHLVWSQLGMVGRYSIARENSRQQTDGPGVSSYTAPTNKAPATLDATASSKKDKQP